MAAGAGATAVAFQQIRQTQRQLDAFLRKRAVARAARFDAYRRMDTSGFAPPDPRVDFPCFHLCQDCGFFAPEPVGACPACGRSAVVDLGDEMAAQRVRSTEEQRRHRSPRWVIAVLAAALGAVCLALVAALGRHGSGWLFWTVLIAGGLSIPAFALLLRPATVLLLRLRPAGPARWHMPVAKGSGRGASDAASGRLEARGPLLVAPFSGSRCVAYQLAVLFDAAGDARPPEWVLHELRSTALGAGGLDLGADSVLLRAPLLPVSAETLEGAGLDLSRFLRERGLFDFEGRFDFFESRLSEGDLVVVEVDRDSGVATVAPAA